MDRKTMEEPGKPRKHDIPRQQPDQDSWQGQPRSAAPVDGKDGQACTAKAPEWIDSVELIEFDI